MTTAYGKASDPHYIANPAKRARAIAAATEAAAAEQAEFASGIAEFRAMMNDPGRRALVINEVGASEAARLAALNDEQLEAELVNSAETPTKRLC